MDEITAEYALPELAAPPELRIRPHVTIAAKTDLGRVRENNEDKFEHYLCEDSARIASRGLLFVVCDGMGGHAAGQIASELACKTFIDVYLNHPATEPEVALRSAANAANRYVFDIAQAIPSRRGMGTTLSSVAMIQDRVYVSHVGDSRVYRWREGEFACLTRDHVFKVEMVAKGILTFEEAERHEQRNMLMRAVGVEPNLEVDIDEHELREGDRFLLCSDGLLNHVGDADIARALGEMAPSEAVWKLVNQALVEGGSDNCTVMIVRVDRLEPISG
jgi:protein phosphatase